MSIPLQGSAFTAVEPEQDINSLCYLRGTGLIFMATEDTKMLTYYIPVSAGNVKLGVVSCVLIESAPGCTNVEIIIF